jgi:hypothetical protein
MNRCCTTFSVAVEVAQVRVRVLDHLAEELARELVAGGAIAP